MNTFLDVNRKGIALFRAFHECQKNDYPEASSFNKDIVDFNVKDKCWYPAFLEFIDEAYVYIYKTDEFSDVRSTALTYFVLGVMLNLNSHAVKTSKWNFTSMPIWSAIFLDSKNYKFTFSEVGLNVLKLGGEDEMDFVKKGIHISVKVKVQFENKFGAITNDEYTKILSRGIKPGLIFVIIGVITFVSILYFLF